MPRSPITALSTKALTSANGPSWSKGKHNFTYSFEYPPALAKELKTDSISLGFSQLKCSITEVITWLIFDYLPYVADIRFMPVKNGELADIHFLNSKFNKTIQGDEIFGRAVPITSFCNKLKRIVICVDESDSKFWYKNCISQKEKRNLPICVNILLHELMHGLGWFNHPWEGSVVLGEKNDSQNVTVLSYSIPKLFLSPYLQRILGEENVRHNGLNLTPLDSMALREKYGSPQNPLAGNLTMDFYRRDSGYFEFSWMKRSYSSVLYGVYFNYFSYEDGSKFRVRHRVTIPEGKGLTLKFSQDQPMVIDTRRGSFHPSYVRAATNYFLEFLPETDIVYLLSCHTFVSRVIVSGNGEKTIYDHSGNVEYHLNSAKVNLFFPQNSGQDVIQGFDPAAHVIVKDCASSPQIMVKGQDVVIRFLEDSLILAGAAAEVNKIDIHCEQQPEIESECVNSQPDNEKLVDASDDFCWPETFYNSASAMAFACGYGFALILFQQFIATKLSENKIPKWGIVVTQEMLIAAIILASRELSILVFLLLLLRPMLTIFSVTEGTINSLETPLNYSLLQSESYSSIGKIASNMINCGSCMFGTWVAKKVCQKIVIYSNTQTNLPVNLPKNIQ